MGRRAKTGGQKRGAAKPAGNVASKPADRALVTAEAEEAEEASDEAKTAPVAEQAIDLEEDNPTLAGAALGALIVLAAYWNSFHNGFHFDDGHIISQNLFIRNLGNIGRFFADARTFSATAANAAYRPLVSLTLALDYHWGNGLDPFWFHVTQITLMLLTGACLFGLYKHLFEKAEVASEKAAIWTALFAAVLFCVHTGNTQVANYISVRSELLSGLGILASFLAYIKFPAARKTYIYLVPMIVGAFAKTPAVMFAPLLLAYIILVEEGIPLSGLFSSQYKGRTLKSVKKVAPALVLAVLLFLFIEERNADTLNNGGPGRGTYLLTQTWVWVRYAKLFFLPTGLSADSDLKPFTGLDVRVIAGMALLGASVWAISKMSRKQETRPVAFGLVWFWIALIPASSIFPLAEMTNDHRAFLPYMGLTVAVVWWVARQIQSGRIGQAAGKHKAVLAALIGGAVISAHVAGTVVRNKVWLNEETLWKDVTTKSPENGRGLMNYGLTQMGQARYTKAKDLFERANKLNPRYATLHVNLAIVNNAMGDSTAAAKWFASALALDPNYSGAHRFYARYLEQHGRGPEAVSHLTRAIALSSADIDARHDLMDLLEAAGDESGVKALADATLQDAPGDNVAMWYLKESTAEDAKSWFRQGLGYNQTKEYAKAAAAFRKSATGDNADAWSNLGWALGALGFYGPAVKALEQAVAINPRHAMALNNMAWARAQLEKSRHGGEGGRNGATGKNP